MARKRLFSGIQPSGEIHIGNWLGAIRKWVDLLDDYDCIFCIVDYHAYTVPQDPKTMQQRIFDAAHGEFAHALLNDNAVCHFQDTRSSRLPFGVGCSARTLSL